MLTIFGRKKKEDENKDVTGHSPSQQQDVRLVPGQAASPVPDSAETRAQTQESRFAKIFNSVSQDYQSEGPSRPEGVTKSMSATPEWVQPRDLPPSKPMIITPHGARVPRDGEGWEEKNEGQKGGGSGPALQPEPKPSTSVPSIPLSRPSTPLGVKDTVRPAQRVEEKPAVQQIQPAAAPVHPSQPQQLASPKASTPPLTRPPSTFNVKDAAKPIQRPEEKPVMQPAPTPAQPVKPKEKEQKEQVESLSGPDSKGESSESPISFNESPSYDFGGFDDLSELLAETDSALALGREKEKEFTVERPARVEKEAAKKESEKKEEKSTPHSKETKDKMVKGFEHLFELTQGALDAPGLVVINGSSGSGKTTVCFGLLDRYLKQGNPCIFVSYGQSPAKVRDGLKQLGCNASDFESSYRLMIVDGYSAQSGGFSLELYSLLEPWDLAKVQETIVGNSGIFMGEKVKVIIDSIDGLCTRSSAGKEFGKQFDLFVSKLKDTGVTVISSCDLAGLGKDVKNWAEEGADCVLELDAESGKDGRKEHSLKVARLKGGKVKGDAEGFEIETGKGLVFV